MSSPDAAARSLPPGERVSAPTVNDAVSAVRLGIWASATRCVLTYVVAPAAGALGLVLGPVGMILQILGSVTAIYGARTLWSLRHRARHVYAVVAAAVTAAAVIAVIQFFEEVLR